jgi:ferredoxin
MFGKNESVLVIGSGPSGVTVIESLVKKNIKVTLVDGYNFEPERGHTDDSNQLYSPLVVKTLSQQFTNFKKLNFGSDYYSESFSKHHNIELASVGGVMGSLIGGGLGNVWGGAVSAYDNIDLRGWPISQSELQPYYDKVSSSLEFSAYYEKNLSTFLDRANKNDNHVNNSLKLSSSKIAFNLNDEKKCTECGKCVYGCPDELLYNPKKRLIELKRVYGRLITHIDDSIAVSFHESTNSVKVFIKNLKTSKLSAHDMDRIFISAGAISSTYLVLKSLDLYGKKINFLNSQHFILPLINVLKNRNMGRTTSHYFIESSALANRAHLQIYLYPNILSDAINFKLLRGLFSPIANRIGFIQGYLHSNDSSTFQMLLEEKTYKIFLEANVNPNVKSSIKKVIKNCSPHLIRMGLLTKSCLLKIGMVGEGNHFGGSFPMSKNPKDIFESDLFGRPYNLKRVHMVDSSIFPTIPSKTITYVVMANSARIVDGIYR